MRTTDTLRLLLLAAIWGASFLFMRIAVPALGAVNTAFLRVVCGSIGLLVIMAVLRMPLRFDGKLRWAMLLGVINSGLPFLMYCLAARVLPAGYSAILNATAPLMGVIMGAAFFAEKLTLKKVMGMVAGFAGILLISTTGEAHLTRALILGILACLVATTCYGIAGFLAKRWITARGGMDATKVAFGSQLGASCFLLPFFAVTAPQTAASQWQIPEVWACILAVGFICTALAYILYFRLLADIGPLRTLTVTFLIPPFGIFWGWLVLGEALNQGFTAGALLIVCAVWLVVKADRPTPQVASVK
ncbi:MAG: DMT family transporter [Pantoea sp.]|uniref:DMT family transporter n=1 Tax=Pantoea phytobeneficialis TaxID=2052056 RepID=A0AAP9HAF3_9GAMM|nr:DMT family transporter [Pantoea phytobeneficialis]MDO6406711.1 DMT family transporter [Pantoea phytobeneficialis]QGR09241.1 EamA family transporter [Pantoea phytobeneficialis]